MQYIQFKSSARFEIYLKLVWRWSRLFENYCKLVKIHNE